MKLLVVQLAPIETPAATNFNLKSMNIYKLSSFLITELFILVYKLFISVTLF
jgi:hypothetical protein